MVRRLKSKSCATCVQVSVVQKHYLWGYTLFMNTVKVTSKITQSISEMGDTSLGNFFPTHATHNAYSL